MQGVTNCSSWLLAGECVDCANENGRRLPGDVRPSWARESGSDGRPGKVNPGTTTLNVSTRVRQQRNRTAWLENRHIPV